MTRVGSKDTRLLVLNQMAGPMTWELVVDLARQIGRVDLLTGHPDTLQKGSQGNVYLHKSIAYERGGNLKRMWCWIRYAWHAFHWMRRWPADTPVLIFSNPPIAAWVGALMHRLRDKPFIVMVHDIYPDAAIRMGVCNGKHPLIGVWRWCNRRAYERASAVMTLGKHMAECIGGQFDAKNTAAGEVVVVPPWADNDVLQPLEKSSNWFAAKHGQADRFTVMYSGNMGRGHDLETILEVARRLRGDDRIGFLFVGAGPKWEVLRQALDKEDLPHVRLLPWQDEDVIPFSLATADLAVVSLEPEMSGLAVPSKAFYFFAVGTPVVAICKGQTELADAVRDFDCGTVVQPGDADQLEQTILFAAGDPDLRRRWRIGTRRASERFSRQRGTDKIRRVIEQFLFRCATPDTTRFSRWGQSAETLI